ncbi:MAG: uroporphyrinogen decarboxylase family protein [Planctomycetota bacterium]|jgi:uroporphyrinogen decarboxylase
MTPCERFIGALEGKGLTGRVPHFELVFYLTMEAFERVHPEHRNYSQWVQMTASERQLHLQDMADIFVGTARRFEHSAILLHSALIGQEDEFRLIDEVRRQSGDEYCLMVHGDATAGIPSGSDMTDFCGQLADDPQKAKDEARQRVDEYLARAEKLKKQGGIDGFCLCSDYCFNSGPFFSPEWFDEFITPYLIDLIEGYRQQGFYVIKHTDGNIMPILDRLVEAGPHALHSLDPQGGVDIAEIKKLIGDRITLIGNVNCGLLDTGTDAECIESARYALKHGMPGGRYIFSTSNCIYTGMRLERYELILDVWRKEGNYPE